ncbi:Hsp70 family protein [Syntrophomonas wolfei]|uniref:Hsp70 family protein n=1 Tax=Syntrophomonas wolfei TaxID=863 RepID=UPI0023F0DBEC|nr:Hsp70 family protein [Syntrophomonas wolfei]
MDVTFAIDRNGILHVSAMDIDTGIQNEIEINGVGYLSKQQQLFRRGKNLKVI